jgi:hypothetical protein
MTYSELCAGVYAPPKAGKPWRLEDLLPGTPVRYFSFARRATAAALRAAGVGYGAAVLVPEFICRDFLSAVHDAGAHPVFYPVDRALNPAADPAQWPKAKAVVAVNFFGFPQDLAPFKAYCAKNQALLIEDNAHGLFSKDAEERWLGSRGDCGIFSLRKTLPIHNGAALSLNAKDRPWKLEAQSAFHDPNGLRPAFRGGIRKLARVGGARASFGALQTLRLARRLRTGHRLPPGDPASEKNLPYPDLPCKALSAPITAAGPETEILRRRELYNLLAAELTGAGFELVFPTLPEGTTPFGLAVRVPALGLSKATKLLAARGLEPMSWPDLPGAVAPNAPAHYKDIQLVHFLW